MTARDVLVLGNSGQTMGCLVEGDAHSCAGAR